MSCNSVGYVQNNKCEPINVCNNNLIESLTCNKPSSEGYDVKNLISNRCVDKNKGFMVERFISPPVILTFQFKSAIYIKYITVYCKVGAQKTTGIEILSQSKTENSEYVSIGSGILNDGESGFVFHRYDETVNNKFSEQYLLRRFKPKSCPFLTSVQRLQIKIFRTSGTSVPALGKVEFWGIPQNVCNINRKGRLFKSEVSRCVNVSENLQSTLVSVDNNTKEACPLSKSKYHKPSLPIPEEFLDPITFEVMSLPIIMPSGKIIDNRTLELYEKAERYWGRGPNDPFTGVMFTDSSKPVAATNLKARIDQYLSLNSNCTELFNIPRTVGRLVSSTPSHSVTTGSVSKLIKHSSSESSVVCGYPVTNHQTNERGTKRRKLVSKSAENSTDVDTPLRFSGESNNIPNTCETSRHTNRFSSFQERMEKSLELSLKSTLSKLPNFTSGKPKIGETVTECNVCKSVNNLFSIPCNHSICRSCLLDNSHKSQMMCLLCNFSYRRNDLNRIHLL